MMITAVRSGMNTMRTAMKIIVGTMMYSIMLNLILK